MLGEKWYVKNHPPIKLVSGKESFDYELNVTCVYVCVCVLYICAKSFSIFMSVLSECCPWGDCGLIPVVLPPTTRESHLMRNLVQLLILISMVSTARRRKTHTQYKSNKHTIALCFICQLFHKPTGDEEQILAAKYTDVFFIVPPAALSLCTSHLTPCSAGLEPNYTNQFIF